MECVGCGTDNRPGRRFCSHCGAALEVLCPACGAANQPEDNFCGACGTALRSVAAPPPAAAVSSGVAERRLVSVLFADLVGFTALSEHRDPEEVRDLLSRYFDRCRTLIERFGGTVEKFIGDAVMAVWGSPVAREDDAERAVRAALSLTQAVAALGDEVGVPELRVRAGVLTGSAAVEVGAEGEGMVLGDTVNTASRIQALAEPGTVLVDDVTRRASEAAIAYEDGGTHPVKGREQPVRAWRALRVVAGAGGARRSAGIEAPFVGRDRQLEIVIESSEESARSHRARLVAVVGDAGSGKSRLLWEFFKYLDGIEEVRWWHQGRCLSYGEGVAYWALAEMVRTRAGIAEEEPPVVAREKLRAAVSEHVRDERERRLVEPRLAHLLRLEERPSADRADLFSGWRLFFERLAETNPVILAFEDLQWADSGLLDFIDYLLEWSADYPILVLALGRGELRARRPGWQPLVLDPLELGEIEAILDGLAPGLPRELVAEIGRRSEGIPLYAVETIRMLQDRGVLVQEGTRYVVTGELSDLDVPETLHALVASRLDGLSPVERAMLQDASVIGHSFSAAAVAAVSERPEAEVGRLLDGLVVKQVLGRDDDPRSPERGQYVFLQGLLRTVAYGTLARRTRKARHLAAARYLEHTWPGELADIAEVLAAHYLEAIRADPGAEDVGELRAHARERLAAAGQAAASLALGLEADRYFEQAAELADDDLERARLYEQAGGALRQSGDLEAAEDRLRRAVALHQANGDASGGPATLALAGTLRMGGRLEEATALLEQFRACDNAPVDAVVRAQGLAELATAMVFRGAVREAGPLFDEALTTLQELQAWPALADALVGHAVRLVFERRLRESVAMLRLAASLADEYDLPTVALRARFNLSAALLEADRWVEAIHEVDEALTVARERGDRQWERLLLVQRVAPLTFLGRWDEATAVTAGLMADRVETNKLFVAVFAVQIAAARADDAVRQTCLELTEREWDETFVDQRAAVALMRARDALEHATPAEALALARPYVDERGIPAEFINEAYVICAEAALRLGELRVMTELSEFVAGLPPARRTPLLRASSARLVAERAHREGDEPTTLAAEAEALRLLRHVGALPLLGHALTDGARRRSDPAALDEARDIYVGLGATAWLEHLEDAVAARVTI